jgi:fimbrial chaperone protein
MRSALACALWAVATTCQITAPPAAAGTLEVGPTTVVLRQDARAGVLYVNNYGNAPVTVQIEPFDWDQAGGADRLTPSDALMVSPPIAAIPPQGRQTVRLMIASAANPVERSFRLLISELPDRMRQVDRSVQVLTQFSVPVFAVGADEGAGKITWGARLRTGRLELAAHNEGASHSKLLHLEIVTPNGERNAPAGAGLNYVLAGSSRVWTVPCARCGIGDTIHIQGSDEASGAKLDDPLVIGP